MEFGVLNSSSGVVHNMHSELVLEWTYLIPEWFDPEAKVHRSLSFQIVSDFEFPSFGFLYFDSAAEIWEGLR